MLGEKIMRIILSFPFYIFSSEFSHDTIKEWDYISDWDRMKDVMMSKQKVTFKLDPKKSGLLSLVF